MDRVRRTALLTGALVALALLTAPAASADLFAILDVPSADGNDSDIATYNVGTGFRSTPLGLNLSGVSTSADEVHPSIVGNKLAFERLDRAAGTRRIIVRDTSTGDQADLFNVFDAQSIQPNDPALTPDGTNVLTGWQVTEESGGGFRPSVLVTPLSSFPGGPFAHNKVFASTVKFQPGGRTLQPAAVGNVTSTGFVDYVYGTELGDRVSIGRSTGASILGQGTGDVGTVSYRHPAMASGGPAVVFQKHTVLEGGKTGKTNAESLFFRPPSLSGSDTAMPSIIGSEARKPTFSSDGRYLAFVRSGRLNVFDTETQLLLNSTGINVGSFSTGEAAGLSDTDGGISLFNRSVFTSTELAVSGSISFSLNTSSLVGIIVQRVVGRTKLFGKSVPKLQLVGRVPLGSFRRGRGRVQWDRKVNGRPLKPGTYQVTVRAVTKSGGIRDLGKPVLVRIRSTGR